MSHLCNHHYDFESEVERAESLRPDYPPKEYEPIVLKEYKGGNVPPKLIWLEDDVSPYYLAWTGKEVDGQRQAVLVKWIPF